MMPSAPFLTLFGSRKTGLPTIVFPISFHFAWPTSSNENPRRRARISTGAQIRRAGLLRPNRRKNSGWLQDDSRHQVPDRLLPRFCVAHVLLRLHQLHAVTEREVAPERDAAARDELVERHRVEVLRHFVARRREQRRIAIRRLGRDRMHRALRLTNAVLVPERLLHGEHDAVMP